MTSDDSAWIAARFAASAEDRTPADLRPHLRVLFAPVSQDADVVGRCAAVMTPSEQQQAARFLTPALRDHYTQRRAFRRYCGALALRDGSGQAAPAPPVSQVEFAATDKGRPYIPAHAHLRFSFSSCRLGFLGAWSATRAIGVDIEDPARTVEASGMAHRFFAPAEADAVDAAGAGDADATRRFFRLWTLKEAALKSIGEGLPFGLDAFRFELEPAVRMVHAPESHGGTKRFQAAPIDGTDDCAAVVVADL